MNKHFKNSFGVQSDNLNLLKAFIQEAEAIGWQHQETDYSALDQTLKLYFGGNDEKYHLKPNHFWTCNSYEIPTTRYDLPSQWDQALEAAREEAKPTIQIGDYVKITNEGLVYSSHSRLFQSLGFRNTVENSGAGCSGLLGMVFAVADNGVVVLALDLENGNQLLIGEAGIEKVKATAAVKFKFNILKGDWVTCLPGFKGGNGLNKDPKYAGYGYKAGHTFEVTRITTDTDTESKGDIAFGGINDGAGVWTKFLRKATAEEIKEDKLRKTIQIGISKLHVTVTKSGATAEGYDLDMDSLRSLYSLMLNPKNVLDSLKCHWPIHISKINIGCCEDVTWEELGQIIDAYDSFQ
jgi:hypothetical protein